MSCAQALALHRGNVREPIDWRKWMAFPHPRQLISAVLSGVSPLLVSATRLVTKLCVSDDQYEWIV
jgi:hypothetical protein